MLAQDWIALAAILLVWLGSIITLWIKINIKMAELEIKINNTGEKLLAHEKWGEAQQQANERKLEYIQCELKENAKETNNKLDKILEYLNNFKIEVEKRLK